MRSWGLLLSLVLVAPCLAVASDAPAVGGEAINGATLTCQLSFRETGFSLWCPTGAEVVFKKEPAYRSENVLRSAWMIGPGQNDYIGYAFDRAADKLYVDGNRNLDLTDDAGVYSGQPAPTPHMMIRGSFKGIHISLSADGVTRTYMCDAQFPEDTDPFSFFGRMRELQVTSGWSGEIALDGVRYRVSIADNLDGKIGAGDDFQLVPADTPVEEVSEDSLPFSFGDTALGAPATLCLGGRTYQLSYAFHQADDQTSVSLTLAEPKTGLGTVTFVGNHIERMTLTRMGANDAEEQLLVVLPAQKLRWPGGRYGIESVELDGGFEVASSYSNQLPVVAVSEDIPTALKLGAPLTPSVKVERSGSKLNLSYMLTDVGGYSYAPPDKYGEDGAKFAVYKGDTLVDSGTFEYG